MRRMQRFRESGTTMVFVTHDMRTVERISDRVAFFEAGQLVEVGEPSQVIGAYRARNLAA